MRISLFARLIGFAACIVAGRAAPPHPAIVRAEFINEQAPYPQCHASTIVEKAQGGLVAAWFGGTHERNPDVGIWLSRFENGRCTLGVDVGNGVQHASKRYRTWNPVLFQPRRRR